MSVARRFFIAMAAFWFVLRSRHDVLPAHDADVHDACGHRGVDAIFRSSLVAHGGLDILSVCLLLVALSTVPATKTTLRLAATVGLLPVAAMVYTLVATPFWSPLFLVPAVGCFGFAIYGFLLAGRVDQ